MTSENHVKRGTYDNASHLHSFFGYPYDDIGEFDGVGVFIRGGGSYREVVSARYRLGSDSWNAGNYFQYGAGRQYETREDAIVVCMLDALRRAGVGGEDD